MTTINGYCCRCKPTKMNERSYNNSLLLFWTLLSLVSAIDRIADWSCDLTNDPCPSNLQFNGVCQSQLGAGVAACRNGDCGDCDWCGAFDMDCTDCLKHGCYWCGESGICTNNDGYDFPNAYGCAAPSDFSREVCNPPGSFFSDPLFTTQKWVFDQIRVEPVWRQGITGAGIRVRVNDDAVDSFSPEFEGRFDRAASCDVYLPQDANDAHGTAMASVLGGAANNDFCSVGVAPDVTLSACHAITEPADVLGAKVELMDISANSYGVDACVPGRRQRRRTTACPFGHLDESGFNPCYICDFDSGTPLTNVCMNEIIDHCGSHYEKDVVGCIEYLDLFVRNGRCEYNMLSPADQEAIGNGIANGRDGKGVIYVWASGNTNAQGDDTNFQGYLNSRLTITIGSTGRDEFHASYSNGGAALFASAPGGDFGDQIDIIAAGLGGSCDEFGKGTSPAAAVAAGVVALILQANNDLGWRDVQGILATTSRMIENDPLDKSLVTNGAGIQHSNFYGFGIIDASAAVEAAKSWELFGPEESKMVASGALNLMLADNADSPTISTLSIPRQDDSVFVVESVVLYLDIRHFSRGDLDVVLTSPAGTESVLSPGNRPETQQLEEEEEWKLLTVRSWGETAEGEWTLSIADISKGDVNTCVDYPWEGAFTDDLGEFSLLCSHAIRRGWCEGGQAVNGAPPAYLTKVDNGRTPLQACCDCGGGFDRGNFVDRLVQWKIVVYGRPMASTRAPTSSPSRTPPLGNNVTPTPADTPTPIGNPPVSLPPGESGALSSTLRVYYLGAALLTVLLWAL